MVRNLSNAPHYTWGGSCDGWHLLASPGLGVIRERMPPGTTEAWHLHREARQCFFVLRGELEIERAGERVRLVAEDALEIAPGTPHRVRSVGDGDAEFLLVSAPPSHGDRVELEGEPA